MYKVSCFSVEKHIAEIHESMALVADFLNIGFYTNFSDRFLISSVEGDAIQDCETKYCIMLWDKLNGELLKEMHVNTTNDILRCGIQMVREHLAIVEGK